jgi:hypothetical protein
MRAILNDKGKSLALADEVVERGDGNSSRSLELQHRGSRLARRVHDSG